MTRDRMFIAILFLLLAFALPGMTASAAESGGGEQPVTLRNGLAAIDWLIIAAYAASTMGLGWYFSRKQSTTQEYFVGSGHMNPTLVGISLFATLLSTISYLSMPGESLGKGPVFLTTLLGHPIVYLVVGYCLLPIYMKQRVTSAYELLEDRLGLNIRMLGASMFIALRLVWMSLLVYLTAEAMTTMIGVGRDWIPVIALITGLIAVIYTSLGGLRAVVITDLIQTLLLYGGALLVLGVITYDFGGFGWFPTQGQENWDRQPLLPTDPQTGAFDLKIRVSVLGSMFGSLIWYICTSGGDQTSVQRFMATRDVRAARRAYAIQLVVSVIVGVTLAFVGFALLAYFQVHADQLPAGMNLKDHADKIFPLFIADHLPVGISGLVVAAMFAAAMSSIDSGVNSITAVVMTDFLDRFGHSPKTEKAHVRAAQFLALAIGTVVVIGSSFMEHVPGNITSMTQKTSNLLTTPIFCLFFFALFVPFARPAGVIVGTICGTVTAAVVAFCGPLVVWLSHWGVDPATFNTVVLLEVDKATGITTETAEDPISFQWIAPASVLVNIGTGVVASLIIAAWKRSQDDLE